MMDLKKQKWCPLISLLILLSTSCNEKVSDSSKDEKLLECLLDVFIKEQPENERYIYVSEMQNWTDTTSVIVFSHSDIPPVDLADSLKTKISDYRNHKVVYIAGSLNKQFINSYMIPNDLQWKKINPKDYKPVSEDGYLIYSEYELQFIYDFKNGKIIDILKSYPVEKSVILKNIKNCEF